MEEMEKRCALCEEQSELDCWVCIHLVDEEKHHDLVVVQRPSWRLILCPECAGQDLSALGRLPGICSKCVRNLLSHAVEEIAARRVAVRRRVIRDGLLQLGASLDASLFAKTRDQLRLPFVN